MSARVSMAMFGSTALAFPWTSATVPGEASCARECLPPSSVTEQSLGTAPVRVQPAAGREGSPLSPLSLVRRGDLLWTVGERGRLIAVDLERERVVHDLQLEGIDDVRSLAGVDADGLAVIGADPPRLVLFDDATAELRLAQALELPSSPWRLAAGAKRLWVSCPSSREVLGFEQDAAGTWQQGALARLAFEPGELLWLDEIDRLLIADRLGNRWRTVDRNGGATVDGTLRGHSIGALARDASGSVLVAHSKVSELAHATRDDVHWGTLARHLVQVVPVERFARPGDLTATPTPLGDVGVGAADPVALAPLGGVGFAVACFGSHVVELHRGMARARIEVGDGPSALYFDEERAQLWVAERWAASLSVHDVVDGRPGDRHELELPGARVTPTLVERGRRLFHDARLSHDGWMSCHTCHTHGETSGRRCDTLSDGSLGTPKRIPGLAGVGDTAPYGWSGAFATLEEQVRKTLASTMHEDEEASDADVAALVAYLQSLPPPPAGKAHPDRNDSRRRAVREGQRLFTSLGCVDCHAPPLYTTPETYDVGLKDEDGLARFNPPSLRGVSRRDGYFHDGRASSLDEVLGRTAHPDTIRPLSSKERAALIAFLEGL